MLPNRMVVKVLVGAVMLIGMWGNVAVTAGQEKTVAAAPMAETTKVVPASPGPSRGGKSRLPNDAKLLFDVQYAKVGGKGLLLDLYLPGRAKGPLPLVVWIHGGAWSAGSKENCPAVGLVGQGYAVASINYRLSQEAIFPAQIEDCKAAIRHLRANAARHSIDPNHIGVWGASAGGHLVALLGTSGDVKELEGAVGDNLAASSRVQCVVDYFGPTDFMQFKDKPTWVKVNQPNSPLARLVGGLLDEKKDLVAKANPITFISTDDPPFLVVHGDKDNTVPINQSELLVAALKDAGVEVTFEVVKGAGHGFNATQSETLKSIVTAFFDRHLKVAAVSGVSIVAGQGKPAPAAVQTMPATSSADGTVKFVAHRVGSYRSEAVGVGDFNNDGKLDIIAGAYLYLAPDFKPLKIRSPKGKVDDNGKGYCMDFMNLPLDVDGDGLLDVVSCGWFEKAAWWCRNTGPGGGEWPETILEKEAGNYETGELCDIDGDGKAKEILPNTASTFWMEIVKGPDGKSQPVKHLVSKDRMIWGNGVGDVNGDGRPDIIRPGAWFEAPADPRKGQWKQHPLALVGLKGKVEHTCQIAVFDVNGDGLNDIITGAAHDYGLFWHEQVKEPSGGSPTFRQHVIDKSWSQVHSLVLADIDGCGTPEIVTGKRFMAHNGGDPGENEPLGVYYYKLHRGPQPQWTRHIISYNEGIGSGVNLVVADLDGDGDLDVIVTGKYGGPVWFENTLRKSSR